MTANARDISLGFDKVNEDVIPFFKETVDEILTRYKPEEALARALALTTGYTQKIKQRSLLLSAEGYITFVIEAGYEIRSPGYIWNILKRYFAPEITDSIKGMSLLASKKGVVFDLPSKHKEIFLDIEKDISKEGFQIQHPTELPEIFERYQSNNRYGGRNNGGYGNNRSYGGY